MPINLITVHMFAYEPNGVPPYNCALTSNGWNGPQYFLKDSLPDYNSQVSSNKIFHLFCRSTIFFFASITEEGFLVSPYYSLELCTEMGIYFLFSFDHIISISFIQ